MGRILIAHADPDIRERLRRLLEADGYWVLNVAKVDEVPNRILSHRPDVALIQLAGGGQSVVDRVRTLPLGQPLPVIGLWIPRDGSTSADDLFLKSGADALLSEDSASAIEVSSLVRTLIVQPPGKKGRRRFLRYGPLELDRDARAVRLGVAIVTDLPPKHFEVLWLLARRATESKDICPRQLLVRHVWKKERVRDREVDVTISRLKNRLPFLADYIETVPGKGYRFVFPALSPRPPGSR